MGIQILPPQPDRFCITASSRPEGYRFLLSQPEGFGERFPNFIVLNAAQMELAASGYRSFASRPRPRAQVPSMSLEHGQDRMASLHTLLLGSA